MTFFRRILLLIAASLIAGCATIPPGAEYPREPSVALAQPETTALGTAFAARFKEHPDMGGFRLLPSGTDGFVLRAEMAASAQRTIDLQYFIFHNDITGRLLLDELLEAADRGVRVRILLDDLNLKGKDTQITTVAAHPNVQVRIFNPASYRGPLFPVRAAEFALDWTRLTYRMHNKLFLVDNVIGVAGGRNVGDEYFSTAKDFEFGDFDVFTVGPAVRRLSNSFDAYWNSSLAIPVQALGSAPTPQTLEKYRAELKEHHQKYAEEEYMRQVAAHNPLDAIVSGKDPLVWANFQVLYDSPEKAKVEKGEIDGHLLRGRLIEAMRAVNKELLIVTPYLVPTPRQLEMLADLHARGVRIRILTNSLESTDVPVVHAGYRKYRVPMLEHGIELYEVRNELGRPTVQTRDRTEALKGDESDLYTLHAKVYVFDRSRVFVGSANFDHRSFRLNTEVGLMIDSPQLAGQVAQRFAAITQPANSYRVSLEEDEQGTQRLLWHTEEDGKPVDYTDEPGNAWREFEVDVMSVLPIESQL